MLEQYLEAHRKALKDNSSSLWGINLALGYARQGRIQDAQTVIRQTRGNAALENAERTTQFSVGTSEQAKKRRAEFENEFHAGQMAILATLERHLGKMPQALAKVEADEAFQKIYGNGKRIYAGRLEGKKHRYFAGTGHILTAELLDEFDRNAEGVRGIKRRKLAEEILKARATQFGNVANVRELEKMAARISQMTPEKIVQEKDALREAFAGKDYPDHWVAQGSFLDACKRAGQQDVDRLADVLKTSLKEQGVPEIDATTLSKLLTDEGAQGHPRAGYLLQYKWLSEQKK